MIECGHTVDKFSCGGMGVQRNQRVQFLVRQRQSAGRSLRSEIELTVVCIFMTRQRSILKLAAAVSLFFLREATDPKATGPERKDSTFTLLQNS